MTLVVKLGGSHADTHLRRDWLLAIGRGAGRIVLVPGGGPFADTVRAMQPVIGFHDAAAHEMALLAMAQFGLALCGSEAGQEARLVPAASMTEIETALGDGLVPVWMPAAMLRGAPDIQETWDVTSDSLAIWLATRLGAEVVLIIKRDSAGSVDPAFQAMRARYRGRVLIAGPEDIPVSGLDAAHPPGHERVVV
ncbi:amino acid kinase family protein [Granulibacter bethesdensis]|uniref:amino acid kinase family protein n=1 Tax=Granulibacter bethesdensis TaxID=364410 RepID=UPI0003F2102D|nr:hypothetical protein [Granulibacter bethesdensis]AHJ66852.1 Amino acid kinase family protein [Granulibacter bethesdensis CGDNIH4]